jgi:hypothetical protein
MLSDCYAKLLYVNVSRYPSPLYTLIMLPHHPPFMSSSGISTNAVQKPTGRACVHTSANTNKDITPPVSNLLELAWMLSLLHLNPLRPFRAAGLSSAAFRWRLDERGPRALSFAKISLAWMLFSSISDLAMLQAKHIRANKQTPWVKRMAAVFLCTR